MPLVKVIRNGQITLPKDFRNRLGIREGDLLEVTLTKSGLAITPKIPMSSELARGRFFQMLEEIRKSVKDIDPKEIDAAIEEVVQAAKQVTAKRIRARPKR